MRGELKLAFWDVVVECLMRFHHISYGEAYQKTIELRGRLRESDRLIAQAYSVSPQAAIAPGGRLRASDSDNIYPGEIIYHEEPFKLACELMDRQLDLTEYWEEYNAILQRHGW
jgi:hypothetical protein